MKAAVAVQRPSGARLLAITAAGELSDEPRAGFAQHLGRGDLVVANDAATLPASLAGTHARSGEAIEIRLAGRRSLAAEDAQEWTALVFGTGDYRTPTENRPLPPRLALGDRLRLGPLQARVERLLDHPRLARIRFEGTADEIWAGIARHGRPIQYAYVPDPLELWDVWAPFSGLPVALEAPSAGFALDWRTLAEIRGRGAGFATITHAAGISSTGDAELDRRLPFDEPYYIPAATAAAIGRTQAEGGRVIAIGTTVVRALEGAVRGGEVRPGAGVATGRIGRGSELRVVDAILSGTHEPGTSHFELLRAFADDGILERANEEMEARGYRTHEFGDSVWIERRDGATSSRPLGGKRPFS